MPPKILVLDPDAAFAAMLTGAIRDLGTYQAGHAASLDQAVAALVKEPYDLAILDTNLLDLSPAEAAEKLRSVRPELRLMLVPGDEGEQDAGDLEVQGLFPKPFFMGELPDLLESALTCLWEQPGEPAAPVTEIPAEQTGDLDGILSELCQGSQARGACVVMGGEIVAQAGTETPGTLSALSEQAGGADGSLGRLAEALGEADGFEHVILEGAQSLLYVQRVLPNLQLLVVASATTPLGSLRYGMRQATRSLQRALEDEA